MEQRRASSWTQAVLRRPMASAAALFIAGIACHRAMPAAPGVYLIFAAACVVGAAVEIWRRLREVRQPPSPCPLPEHRARVKKKFLRRALSAMGTMSIAAALWATGLAAAQIESFYYPADDIAHFAGDEPRMAQLELTITQPPRLLKGSGQRPLPPRQVTQGTVTRILTHDGWRPASGTVLISIAQPKPHLTIRDRVRVLGMLQRPMGAANPGQFDWAEYYREQRIVASLSVPMAENMEIITSPGPTLLDRLRQGARDALGRRFAPARAIDAALLRALVLGDSDPQLRDVQDDFMRTGTSHHLAISGMHIAVLGGLVLGICRLMLLRPRLAAWIGMAFVILYGAVALPSPPVVRSVLLCIAFGLGMVGRRSLDGIQLLALSVLAMLAYHPLDLYNAGFQLSFGTVLGLMLFTRPLHRFLESLRDRHDIAADGLRSPRFGLRLRRKLFEMLVPGLVAWAVSAPLIAWHFNQLNPWGIPASILLAVPVFFALVGGLAKIALTLLLPGLAPLLATVAGWPVIAMRVGAEWLAKLPGNDVSMVRPSVWLILLYYALLALPLVRWSRARADKPPVASGDTDLMQVKWRRWIRLAPAGCAVVFLCPLFFGRSGDGSAGQLRLTLLSVGAGQCAVVQLPSGRTILVDVGSASIGDLGRTCLYPCLKQLGVRRIDSIFVSHANFDHYSGVADAAERFDAQHVYVGPSFELDALKDAAARALVERLTSGGRPPQAMLAPASLKLDEQATLDIVWPPDGRKLDANDASLVLKLTCNGRSIVFCGDIQAAPQRELTGPLTADVLVAPHHGSAEMTTAAFVDAVDPGIILCSNGRQLSQKQRSFDAQAGSRRVYRTDRYGAVTLAISADGAVNVQTFLAPMPAHGAPRAAGQK